MWFYEVEFLQEVSVVVHDNVAMPLPSLRSAHLLLNLFALMIHSSIPDIAVEQEKSVQKVGCIQSEGEVWE